MFRFLVLNCLTFFFLSLSFKSTSWFFVELRRREKLFDLSLLDNIHQLICNDKCKTNEQANTLRFFLFPLPLVMPFFFSFFLLSSFYINKKRLNGKREDSERYKENKEKREETKGQGKER